jgi:hypothetical protein
MAELNALPPPLYNPYQTFLPTTSNIAPIVNTNFNAALNWRPPRDPLVLDLDGDGIEATAIDPNAPVLFDHDASGSHTATGSISAITPWLQYAGQQLAPIRRSRSGSNMPVCDTAIVHTVVCTVANVNNVTQAYGLVHGKETDVLADSGYQGVDKRELTQALDKITPMGAIKYRLAKTKASIRATGEHPFRVVKRQFGHIKVRYRGLLKNTAQLHTFFALSNLWTVRRTLIKEMQA